MKEKPEVLRITLENKMMGCIFTLMQNIKQRMYSGFWAVVFFKLLTGKALFINRKDSNNY